MHQDSEKLLTFITLAAGADPDISAQAPDDLHSELFAVKCFRINSINVQCAVLYRRD